MKIRFTPEGGPTHEVDARLDDWYHHASGSGCENFTVDGKMYCPVPDIDVEAGESTGDLDVDRWLLEVPEGWWYSACHDCVSYGVFQTDPYKDIPEEEQKVVFWELIPENDLDTRILEQVKWPHFLTKSRPSWAPPKSEVDVKSKTKRKSRARALNPFEASFSPEFWYGEYGTDDAEPSEYPTSVFQAIISMSDEDYAAAVEGILGSYIEHTGPRELLRAAQETNTVTDLRSPVEVWLDEQGHHRVRVYDEDDARSRRQSEVKGSKRKKRTRLLNSQYKNLSKRERDVLEEQLSYLINWVLSEKGQEQTGFYFMPHPHDWDEARAVWIEAFYANPDYARDLLFEELEGMARGSYGAQAAKRIKGLDTKRLSSFDDDTYRDLLMNMDRQSSRAIVEGTKRARRKSRARALNPHRKFKVGDRVGTVRPPYLKGTVQGHTTRGDGVPTYIIEWDYSGVGDGWREDDLDFVDRSNSPKKSRSRKLNASDELHWTAYDDPQSLPYAEIEEGQVVHLSEDLDDDLYADEPAIQAGEYIVVVHDEDGQALLYEVQVTFEQGLPHRVRLIAPRDPYAYTLAYAPHGGTVHWLTIGEVSKADLERIRSGKVGGKIARRKRRVRALNAREELRIEEDYNSETLPYGSLTEGDVIEVAEDIYDPKSVDPNKPVLAAGAYVIATHDVDGETLLYEVAFGYDKDDNRTVILHSPWDPNSAPLWSMPDGRPRWWWVIGRVSKRELEAVRDKRHGPKSRRRRRTRVLNAKRLAKRLKR